MPEEKSARYSCIWVIGEKHNISQKFGVGKMHFLHTCSNMSGTKSCMEIRVDLNEDLQPVNFTFMIYSGS